MKKAIQSVIPSLFWVETIKPSIHDYFLDVLSFTKIIDTRTLDYYIIV